ncbi:DUF7832 domain-containing protein [Asticcacaulis taihuensis]|uniref:DUF7832 domain-containing protein n=1 Tax=Asticcacaulis taihuensis TaxID=260084 RepID=A0A1G4QB63_9CAUL|nr:hypothetical protein [Asticcacaulis taihuensis]SCW41820.1 hypothetical protein SAMN02927928_1076 [Asticcacaulis taihuensis]
MKYDDASWHYGGDFPADLPPSAGVTHIAMFAVWCWENGLAGDEILEEADALEAIKRRRGTPGGIFNKASDEKFIDADLNDEGNRFAASYYGDQGYYIDYAKSVGATFSTLYHVPDTWETYDTLKPVISHRYRTFHNMQKSWWRRLWPIAKQ